jgi:prepilin-type N-terminal cleavage/methylation domain-containing protein
MLKQKTPKIFNFRGFTLFELLISVFIIVLLAGAIFTGYRRHEKTLALKRAISKLIQDIRRAEAMAMSAQQHNGINPPGGYGAYFNKLDSLTSYIIFADSDGDYKYDGGNEFVEEIEIEKGIEISQLVIREANTGNLFFGDELWFVFIPPDPKVIVNGFDNREALIELTSGSASQTVQVNVLGLIGAPREIGCSCQWKVEYCADETCNGITCLDNPPLVYADCCCYNCVCFPEACPKTCDPPGLDRKCECIYGGLIK